MVRQAHHPEPVEGSNLIGRMNATAMPAEGGVPHPSHAFAILDELAFLLLDNLFP